MNGDCKNRNKKHNKQMKTGMYKYTVWQGYKDFREQEGWFTPKFWRNETGKGLSRAQRLVYIVLSIICVVYAILGTPQMLILTAVLTTIIIGGDIFFLGLFAFDQLRGYFYYMLEKIN